MQDLKSSDMLEQYLIYSEYLYVLGTFIAMIFLSRKQLMIFVKHNILNILDFIGQISYCNYLALTVYYENSHWQSLKNQHIFLV